MDGYEIIAGVVIILTEISLIDAFYYARERVRLNTAASVTNIKRLCRTTKIRALLQWGLALSVAQSVKASVDYSFHPECECSHEHRSVDRTSTSRGYCHRFVRDCAVEVVQFYKLLVSRVAWPRRETLSRRSNEKSLNFTDIPNNGRRSLEV